MSFVDRLRSRVKAARKRGAAWVRVLDVVRLLPTSAGRSQLITRWRHGDAVHQMTPQTAPDRYPELFERAAKLAPNAARILSFGCSTGEELLSIRQRFPEAEIIGVEINRRSRDLAERLTAHDRGIMLVSQIPTGTFDLIFALAVLQREPHKVVETGLQDLSGVYPFARFDQTAAELVARLAPQGILCVQHAHYRIEDSRAAGQLDALPDLRRTEDALFGRDSCRLAESSAAAFFRKRA